MTTAETVLRLPGEPRTTPTPDPASAPRPAPAYDADSCEDCNGTGLVHLPGARWGRSADLYGECRACDGTGDRRTPATFQGWAV